MHYSHVTKNPNLVELFQEKVMNNGKLRYTIEYEILSISSKTTNDQKIICRILSVY